MANKEHLAVLGQGVGTWNHWREENPEICPDLRGITYRDRTRRYDLPSPELSCINFGGADLTGGNLMRATLDRAIFTNATLRGLHLNECDLRQADFTDADLSDVMLPGADLRGARLTSAVLRCADLTCADLSGADLSGANLTGASLVGARLVRVNLENSVMERCYVYGVSAWSVRLDGAKQGDLVITEPDDLRPDNPYEAERVCIPGASRHVSLSGPLVSVDSLEVAQFLYLLLNNQRLREVIDTITSKVVLILGRFSPERKAILDALRNQIRVHDLVPILFDADGPTSRDFTETVSTLAHLARFIIADITDARSIPQELQAIIPTLAVPIQPLLSDGVEPYGMFADFQKYSWVLPIHRYTSQDSLLASLCTDVIAPAMAKAEDLKRSVPSSCIST